MQAEKTCPKGHVYISRGKGCYACRAENQRRYRIANGNAATRKYEKTPSGFLMRAYRNMESRVTGVQKKKHHLYAGKSLCSREEFYAWADSSLEFWRLFREWERSGYDRRLTPSVNRIDAERGYELDNMEWITHSENSRLIRRDVAA